MKNNSYNILEVKLIQILKINLVKFVLKHFNKINKLQVTQEKYINFKTN
jgi:hypothetical protein